MLLPEIYEVFPCCRLDGGFRADAAVSIRTVCSVESAGCNRDRNLHRLVLQLQQRCQALAANAVNFLIAEGRMQSDIGKKIKRLTAYIAQRTDAHKSVAPIWSVSSAI